MRSIRILVVSIAAAAVVTATLCAHPSAAGDVRHAAAAKARGAASPFSAVKAQQRTSTGYARQARRQPVRLASLARQGCAWSGAPCTRPFVLILGIGF